MRYVELPELLRTSDILSMHCPLTSPTRHLIEAAALARMKPGAMLINTSRGAVVGTRAVICAPNSGELGSLWLDVCEEEGDLCLRNMSAEAMHDDVFARRLTFPNVVVTGHQAFVTEDALGEIAQCAIANLDTFEVGGHALHAVSIEHLA